MGRARRAAAGASAANSSMWIGDEATWAPHFRVFALDLPGEPGRSVAVRPSLASDAHARWLADVLDQLRLARAAFAGISLGGLLRSTSRRDTPTACRSSSCSAPAASPHAELVWLPEAGHLLVGHAERIRDFLLRAPTPAS